MSPVVVTVPSGPTDAPPEHDEYSAWQVSGAGQSAAVLQACGLATQVPVVLACGGGASHFVFAAQVGAMVGMRSMTQSKSALGQSATLVQTMGLGSQIPVVGVGTGSGMGTGVGGNDAASGLAGRAAPASVAGTEGVLVGGLAVVTQLLPAGQVVPEAAPAPGFATLPPAPPVPSLALPVAAPVPILIAPPTGATPAVPGVELTAPPPVLFVPPAAYPRTH